MSDAAETGKRIRAERESRGWSQSELAAMTGWRRGKGGGITPAAIGNYEQGIRNVSRANANLLAKVFGMPAGYFTGDLSPEEARMIKAYRSTL